MHFILESAVFVRDIPQVAAVGVNLWFYGTPIIYPAHLIPEQFTPLVIWFNPMTAIVENYRSMIILGQDIHWNWLGSAFLISLAIFLTGFSLYKRLQPGFADVI